MKEILKHGFAVVNGIRMHYVSSGEGKLLLLLHGFPDFWYVWRNQIPELARHFRVVAPDLRGYNESDKPAGISSYRLNVLAADILGLKHALSEEKASIVGHDWGGIVAWSIAAFNPEHTERLVVLNAPHPNAYAAMIKSNLKQLQKSWYVFFFQTPDVPEEVLSRNNYSFLKSMVLQSLMKKNAVTKEDIKAYEEAWSRPGALTAAINYYRANMNPSTLFLRRTPAFPKITVPTLVIWGEHDAALSKDLIANTDRFVDAPYSVEYIPECGHWVQLEEPSLVNRHILNFLSPHS